LNDTVTLKVFQGHLQSHIISQSVCRKRDGKQCCFEFSGGTQAVTGLPRPKLEGNSRHATQQPETHDHQWLLDVPVVRRVSTSKQTGDDDVLVHQPSTEVSQQGTVAQCHGGNDASEHTNETVFILCLFIVTTSARSRVSRASRVRERRTLRIYRSAVKQAPTVAVMWALIVRSAMVILK